MSTQRASGRDPVLTPRQNFRNPIAKGMAYGPASTGRTVLSTNLRSFASSLSPQPGSLGRVIAAHPQRLGSDPKGSPLPS